MKYYIRHWSQDTQESGRWLVLPRQFNSEDEAQEAANKTVSKLSIRRPIIVSEDDLTPTELEDVNEAAKL